MGKGHFTDSASIFSISLLIVEIVLGLAGNLHFLVLAGQGNSRWKVSQWLVVSLCSVGTICCGIGIPFFLATLVMNYLQGTPISSDVCPARYGILVCSFFANSFAICALSLEQHDSILRPFKKRITHKNVIQCVLAIWTISLALGILPLTDSYSSTCILLRFEVLGLMSSLVMNLAGITAVITTTSIVLTYYYGYSSMRKISNRLRQTTSNSTQANAMKRNYTESQVTRLFSKIAFFYLLSWLPPTIWHQVVRRSRSLDPTIASDIQLCLFVISFAIYVINPFIYKKNLGKVDTRLSGRLEERACDNRQNSVFLVGDKPSRANDKYT